MKKIFTFLSVIALASFSDAQIVISEVYGGGGSSSSTYINDYVELVNLGTATATLSGATLQYAAAGGNFNSYIALPNITLQPGQKYLIEMVPSTANTTGAPLPSADFQAKNNTSFSNGTTYNGGFNMAAASGKVALSSGAVQVTSPTGTNVLDFVGYGTANAFEGAGAAPTLDATTSATRGKTDTNNNAADFTKTAPNPQNTGSSLSISESDASKINFIKNTAVTNTIGFSAKGNVKIYSVNGQLVKSASVNDGTSLDVSALGKGIYIVTAEIDGQKVSQKIIKK